MHRETKMTAGESGGYSIGDLIRMAASKIASLFSRTEEIEREEQAQELDDFNVGDELRRRQGRSRSSSLDAAALRGALETLQGRLEDATTAWESTQAEADRVKRDIANLTAGIQAITDNFAQQYAQDTASIMADRLASASAEWDAISKEAQDLRVTVLELQEQVRAIEARIEEKRAGLGLEAKAFWDPQDDEDRGRLLAYIEDLDQRIGAALVDADPDEMAALRAEVADLYDGLSDDTRYRVEELLVRIDTGLDSARDSSKRAGAHALYR